MSTRPISSSQNNFFGIISTWTLLVGPGNQGQLHHKSLVEHIPDPEKCFTSRFGRTICTCQGLSSSAYLYWQMDQMARGDPFIEYYYKLLCMGRQWSVDCPFWGAKECHFWWRTTVCFFALGSYCPVFRHWSSIRTVYHLDVNGPVKHLHQILKAAFCANLRTPSWKDVLAWVFLVPQTKLK